MRLRSGLPAHSCLAVDFLAVDVRLVAFVQSVPSLPQLCPQAQWTSLSLVLIVQRLVAFFQSLRLLPL